MADFLARTTPSLVKKILFPTDGSDTAQRAALVALDLAGRYGATLAGLAYLSCPSCSITLPSRLSVSLPWAKVCITAAI